MQAALPESPEQPKQPKQPEKPATSGQSKASEAWGQVVNYDYTESDANRVWGSHAAVYKYDGADGDIGPEYPELETQLFGAPDQRFGVGVDFSK